MTCAAVFSVSPDSADEAVSPGKGRGFDHARGAEASLDLRFTIRCNGAWGAKVPEVQIPDKLCGQAACLPSLSCIVGIGSACITPQEGPQILRVPARQTFNIGHALKVYREWARSAPNLPLSPC